jgi:hypothetical protein
MNLQELHESKKVVRWANITLVWSCLEIVGALVLFKQTEYNLVSPFIPKVMVVELCADYVNGGLILSAGFVPALVLKIYNKNLFVALISTLALVCFYVQHWFL